MILHHGVCRSIHPLAHSSYSDHNKYISARLEASRMEVDRVGGRFRATDAAKNTVRVEPDDWEPTDDAPSPYDMVADTRAEAGADPDETICGRTTRIELPGVFAWIRHRNEKSRRRFDVNTTETTVTAGESLVRFSTMPRVFVRFDGSASLRRPDPETVVLEFPDPTVVTVLLRSNVDEADHHLQITKQVGDVAAALSAASVANERTSPDRTWPTTRNHPPEITVGPSLSIPEATVDERPDTGIDLRVPPDLRYLITGASLIHYLGATVTVASGPPELRSNQWHYELPKLPEYQTTVNSLLRRVFFLDCLARSAGPHGGELSEVELLSELGLDAAALYEAPLADRVRRYLDAPFESVSGELPDWHLAVYVEPSFEHVPTLPHLLERLPAIYLPSSRELTKSEWIQLSLDEGYEEQTLTRVQREISNVDLVKPELKPAHFHGWLAPDVPIDVFKTFPEAYDNRDAYIDDGPLSVVAVLNNAEMRSEHDAAVRHYNSRVRELNLDLTVRENVRTDELARIFESRSDLVHFIGHRDDRGLECADGFLSLASLDESNAQSFFLNACGSYYEGVELIRKGSVAGAVTFEAVTDKQAAEVGTTFARLLMNGYSIERALDKARQQVMTPKDYAVVGDGTHVLTQGDNTVPPDILLREADDGYRLQYGQISPRLPGSEAQEKVPGQETGTHLITSERCYNLSSSQVAEALSLMNNPIIYNGKLLWPSEFDTVAGFDP